jgi:hypothetical protein
MTDLAPYYSAFRSVAIFGSGIAATFGLTSVGQSGDIVGGVDHMIAGAKEIMTGVGILAPVVLGAWGMMTHRPTAVIAAVEALPDVAKIVVKPTASPDIKEIVADTSRPKVVAG